MVHLINCVTIVYSFNPAQCALGDLVTADILATSLRVQWVCWDQAIEFEVRFQVDNLGQCDERGSRTEDPFDLKITQWSRKNGQEKKIVIVTAYIYIATLTDLFPHSTYRVYVRTREPTGAPGVYHYETSYDYSPDPTSEAGE